MQVLDAEAAHSVAAGSERKLEVVSVVVSAVANHAVVKAVREVVHVFASRHFLSLNLLLFSYFDDMTEKLTAFMPSRNAPCR